MAPPLTSPSDAWSVECRGVLFDVDGTLVDSADAIRSAWRWLAETIGIDPEPIVAASVAARAQDLVDRFVPPDLQARALDLSREAGLAAAASVVALPGAAALLDALPTTAWGCVTSGREQIVTTRLRAAGLPIPSVFVTSEDVSRGKPDPEPYLRGAAVLDLDPADCLAFEDTTDGVASARGAGMPVVAVVGTFEADALAAAGATSLVHDLRCLSVDATDGLLRVTAR
ncbi:HAD-IA family hydrolase [Cellulomonas fimi]|uniref:HAD-IA family hydrolase n=1 Tax=Cellulomonas fimi TaxID=1708 RepID=UPI00234E0C5A|nr:HAD-IA family hydrolase [Cellulomonas fimi]MDC7120484.1 HAD-IA family hydrolase [Cellulomonas fimi]